MSDVDDSISATQLSNNMWVWVYQPDNGAWFQSPAQFKTKAAAQKAGRAWLEAEEAESVTR